MLIFQKIIKLMLKELNFYWRFFYNTQNMPSKSHSKI